MSHDVCASCGQVVRDHDETGAPGDHAREYVAVPVTRRARVTLIDRIVHLGSPLSGYGCSRVQLNGAGADGRLRAGDIVAVRPDYEGATFRAGLGCVYGDQLDLGGIAAVTLDDLLYRVEPA